MTDEGIRVEPLSAQHWEDVVELFGPSGANGQCWCTWWRQSGPEFSKGYRDKGAGNRTLLHELTTAGRQPGLLAYRDGRPVGWLSIAPRVEYRRVLRSRSLGPGRGSPETADESVWSVVCFWMPRSERGHGLASALLAAAIEHARKGGARIIEAYPTDTGGTRHPSAGLFTGTLAMFERAGFQQVERRTSGQPIVRLIID